MPSQSTKLALLAMLILSTFPVSAVIGADRPAAAARAKAPKVNKVAEWFQKYDDIRHRAQMSPQEKERSNKLLTQGMIGSVFKTADGERDKQAADALLHRMVDRYVKAQGDIEQLPSVSETKKLQAGYRHYFIDAGGLFTDYLKIQGNLFATDASGNSLVAQLTQRKAALECLDVTNKDLDARLRAKYNIAPYAW